MHALATVPPRSAPTRRPAVPRRPAGTRFPIPIPLPIPKSSVVQAEEVDPRQKWVMLPVFASYGISLTEMDHGNAYLPPAQPEAEEQARIPCAHGDEGRPPGSEPSPEARPEASGRLHRQEAVAGWNVPVPSRPDDARRRLPRERRIAHGAEIRDILRRGKRSGTAHLDVFDSTSPALHPRVGVIVPRHRHSIVQRNLVKRRLREVLRLEVLPRLEACGLAADVIVRARRDAYGASFQVLSDELVSWTRKRCSRARSS